MTAHLPALLVALPLLAAALTPFVAATSPRTARIGALGVMALVHVCAWLALGRALETGPWHYDFGGWLPPWGIEYVVDALSGGMAVLVSLMAFLATLYAGAWTPPRTPFRSGALDALLLLLLAGLLGIVLTGDLFNLYVFIEISSLAAYPLLAMGDGHGVVATFRYLLLSTIAASFYLLGVGFLYAMTGTLNMADMAVILQGGVGGSALPVAVALIVTGLLIKIALFPLHGWLPDVYTYAPPAVIGFVAAVMTKVTAYALFRILYFVLGAQGVAAQALDVLGWVAAVAILAGSLMALVQRDVRRVLAYSSISQLGYIVLGFAIGNAWALTGALLHIVNHAVVKGCLFMAVGSYRWRSGATDLADLAGLGRRMPVVTAAFTVAAISIIGLPPTAGFFSKWYLAVGAVQAGQWPFLAVLILSSVMSGIYFYRVLAQVFFAPSTNDPVGPVTPWKLEVPAAMMGPVVLLAVAAVVLGIFNQQIVEGVITHALPPVSH